MRQWRLICDQPTTGARNMAVDEAILRAVAAGAQPPTLRLYAWSPACLSLGYGQRVADVDLSRLAARGWQLVRRLTGGRAILHTDELTYSVLLPADHPLGQGDVIESYRQISEALLHGLRLLGAQPAADPLVKRIEHVDAVCFETPSHYEITVAGRKLVGSAQARKHGGILQHGTLPLTGNIARICDVLVYSDADARAASSAHVLARATTLETALARGVSWDTAAQAIIAGFASAFDLQFTVGALSSDEDDIAVRLTDDVYAHVGWTHRR
jgi:lipoate-protein ligase A